MDGGLVGVMSLVGVNIAAVAFSYGMLTQKVNDLRQRVVRMEGLLNGGHSNPGPNVKKNKGE